MQEGNDLLLWKKRYLRNELGWIRIFKKNTKNAECTLDVVASDIIDIGTPFGSKQDRAADTLIILVFKEKEVFLCAETTKVHCSSFSRDSWHFCHIEWILRNETLL